MSNKKVEKAFHTAEPQKIEMLFLVYEVGSQKTKNKERTKNKMPFCVLCQQQRPNEDFEDYEEPCECCRGECSNEECCGECCGECEETCCKECEAKEKRHEALQGEAVNNFIKGTISKAVDANMPLTELLSKRIVYQDFEVPSSEPTFDENNLDEWGKEHLDYRHRDGYIMFKINKDLNDGYRPCEIWTLVSHRGITRFYNKLVEERN